MARQMHGAQRLSERAGPGDAVLACDAADQVGIFGLHRGAEACRDHIFDDQKSLAVECLDLGRAGLHRRPGLMRRASVQG